MAHDRPAQDLLTAIRERTSILITGPRGVGKTMLCSAVIEQLDRRTLTSFLAEPVVSAEALFQRLLLAFGASPPMTCSPQRHHPSKCCCAIARSRAVPSN